MTIEEYNKIKEFNYENYFNYLQEKYGTPEKDYFINENCKTKNTISRAKEGLIVHHRYENEKANLEDTDVAITFDFYAQKSTSLCYANMLEHLFLHYLIAKYHSTNTENDTVTIELMDYIKKLYKADANLNRWDRCYLNNIKDCYDIFNSIVSDYTALKTECRVDTDNDVNSTETIVTDDYTEPQNDTEKLTDDVLEENKIHDETYWFNLWKSVENDNIGHQICFHANALNTLNKNLPTYEKDRKRLLEEIEEIYKKFC